MNGTWYRDLFSVGGGPIPAALFVRVAVAVGLPLVGFTLAGHPLAGVAGGATAMFVMMCDVGVTRANRVGTMLAGTAAILAGGVIGHEWGGTTLADETVVLLAALLAGWVSNSHPGISAVARFGALATAAGTGLHMPSPATEAVWAIVGGGAAAIGTAFAAWALTGIPPADNMMDWRAGVRRAFAGADAGPWYAICFGAAAAVSLLAADRLGVSNAYWATLTVIMVMRREGMVSLKLVIQYIVGTLVGIPIAYAVGQALHAPLAIAFAATLVAASARLGIAVNPALGFAAFTAFLMLVVDLARHGAGVTPLLLSTRFYDVAVGCAIVLVGTLLASLGVRKAEVAQDQ